MSNSNYIIRNANTSEFSAAGKLLVRVYSQLDGFPKQSEQPEYYKLLEKVGDLTDKPGTEIIVCVSSENIIVGVVVYFNEMKYYSSGGTATRELNAAGFRLLAVDPAYRGQGIGKLLSLECIRRANESGIRQIIIHTTMAMQTAWKMYESIGFKRSEDLDFMQGELLVFGFRLLL